MYILYSLSSCHHIRAPRHSQYQPTHLYSYNYVTICTIVRIQVGRHHGVSPGVGSRFSGEVRPKAIIDGSLWLRYSFIDTSNMR